METPNLTHATIESPAPSRAEGRSTLALAVGAWLLLALALGVSGVLPAHPRLIAGAALATLATWVVSYRRSATVRTALDALRTRSVLALHTVRIGFGVLFVFEHAHGRMNGTFALRAGPGDIAIGVLALALLALPRIDRARFRRMAFGWGVLGFVDILVAFFTAQALVLVDHDASMLDAIGRLPYSLLPTFVVPMVVLTHVLVLARIRRMPR